MLPDHSAAAGRPYSKCVRSFINDAMMSLPYAHNMLHQQAYDSYAGPARKTENERFTA